MNDHDRDQEAGHETGKSTFLSRRAALTSGLAVTATAGGFILGHGTASAEDNPRTTPGGAPATASAEPSTSSSPHGPTQPGITRPNPRQAHMAVLVCDIAAPSTTADLLDRLGEAIAKLSAGASLNGIDPADLTITVGVGPRVVISTLGKDAPGAEDLPEFRRERIPDDHRGGDLLLQICSDELATVALAGAELLRLFEAELTLRWHAQGFRGRPDHGVGRNLLGFHDGLVVPHTRSELDSDVWLAQPDQLAGSTFAVVRVMPIDVHGFSSMDLDAQQAAIGRERDSGKPLSGGTINDDIDLHAKLPSGLYTIGNNAHTRRAHPMPAGATGLMLRRSYSYDNGPGDQGLIFISFQNDLDTFTKTQHRIDEGDALLDHTTTTSSGSFLILPGFDPGLPLGRALR